MTSNNEKEIKKTEAPREHPSKKESQPSSNPKTARIALVLALLSLVLAFYTLKTNQGLIEKNKVLIEDLASLKQAQSKADQQISLKETEVKQQQNILRDNMQGLNKTLQKVLTKKMFQNQESLLLKARYYLELAQVNAHWSDNTETSIALLKQTDDILSQIESPSVYQIRQILAANISQLKTTPTLDSAGLLSQLDALQNSIGALKESTMNYCNSEFQKNQTQKSPSSWKTALKESLGSLQKLVVVHKVADPFQPLMSPLYQSTLIESIKLNLQEAQWAILNKNPKIYQLTLKQAIEHLKIAFKEETPETSAILKQLKDLQQINLINQQPQVDEALPLINQLIDTVEPTTSQDNNSAKGGDQP